MNNLNAFLIQEGRHMLDEFYYGFIEKTIFNNDLEMYLFRFKSKQRFNVDFYSGIDGSVSLLINMNDKKSLSFKNHNDLNVVSPFSSAIVYSGNKVNISCIFEPQATYHFVIIKSKYPNIKCGSTNILKKLSKHEDNLQSNFVRSGVPNLTICETVKKIIELDKSELENKLIAMGYSHIIFGLLFKEKSINSNMYLNSNFFRSHEIKQLELLTSEIKENPEQQYTLTDLCRKTGLSATKIQAGFKQMHNCTVAIFIRETRLAKAIEMLQQTDLNISEIVYSVGLNSRSYFCRVFKQRFKCSPKSYQKKLRNTLSSAS